MLDRQLELPAPGRDLERQVEPQDGFKGETAAQVAKSLKAAISTANSGVTITDGTAVSNPPTPAA